MAITAADTRLTPELIAEFVASGEWGEKDPTAYLEDNARLAGNAEAFIDDRCRVTWSEVLDRSTRLAWQLHALGIRGGDVVAVQLPNRVEFVYVMAALARIGAVMCQFPPDYRKREVGFILEFSEAMAVVVPRTFRDFDYVAMIEELGHDLPNLRHRLLVDHEDRPSPIGWVSLNDLSGEPLPYEATTSMETLRPSANDVMRIAFTSGTTGQPKAVIHTYNTTFGMNVLRNQDWRIGSSSRFLQFLPVGLNAGLMTVVQTIIGRGSAVLMQKFEPDEALRLIARERVTHFLTAPTGLIALLNSPELDRVDVSSLRLVQSSGSSTPVEVLREANRRLDVPVIDVYGMLESGWTSCTDFREPYEEWVGTVGRPFASQRVRLLDDEGHDVPSGEQGEICKRSGAVCVGYYKSQEHNVTAWTEDGWFRSGDLGKVDESGRLSITGRKKDMIIHGGANIWPREIEEVLHTHEKVLNAAVIGVPDDYFGENVCACLVLREGESMDLEELNAYIADKLAKYKWPQRLEVMAGFPVGPTGKIQKQLLRQRFS